MIAPQAQRVREIDLGTIEPYELHASYAGLAQGQAPEDEPLILWARSARPHISIGASQAASLEVDLAACERRGVPIINRPLGGGTVWVDEGQLCCFIVLPHGTAPRRPARLFDLALEPMVRALKRLGLSARRVGEQDIWVGDRKIQGSGAATIGRSAVLGTSFLRRFDIQGFTELVRCPSEAYRQWLLEELMAGMSDWVREGIEVREEDIASAVRAELGAAHGWAIEASGLEEGERRGIVQARSALEGSPELGARRLVRYGIKINQRTYLLERLHEDVLLRLVVQDDRIKRAYCSEGDQRRALDHGVGEPIDARRLRYRFEDAGLTGAQAEDLAAAIVDMCVDTGA